MAIVKVILIFNQPLQKDVEYESMLRRFALRTEFGTAENLFQLPRYVLVT